jgi:hypothetical protein
MTIRRFARVALPFLLASLLAACHGAGQMTSGDDIAGLPPVQQDTLAPQDDTPVTDTSTDTSTGTGTGITTMSMTQPASTSFLPSSWGKIGTFQIFDMTSNGYITASAASQHGWRYSSVWGARTDLATTWRNSNSGIKDSYYFIAVTDMSTGAWGGIGHSLTWWQTYHPSWVLYACTSSGSPTHTPAYVGSLKNVPLDFHNPSVVKYQIYSKIGPYAKGRGYTAVAADEVTYWAAGSGGSGYYPCGIWSGGKFYRRYSSKTDPAYATDMVNWVKTAHSYLKTYFPSLKLIVNHPASSLSTNETTIIANSDGLMDEGGFTDYGRYITGSPSHFKMEVAWMRYAQNHGKSVMINQDWGSLSLGPAQRDYSVATYLMGNEQSAAVFISQHNGYGLEQWRSEYATNIGAPCGEYYAAGSTSPSIFYRRFSNAFVVVNAGGSTQTAHLPSGHTYYDLEGRGFSSTMSIPSNNGYVLKTTNGCS